MHKSRFRLALFLAALALTSALTPKTARAAADRQSFFGMGPGFEVLSSDGAGTGFYFQLLGGYNFDSTVGVGLHAGWSNVGGVSIRTYDFGAFLQLTDGDSGIYGKFFLDGVSAANSAGGGHGVKGSRAGFATGVAAGVLIPSAGDFHMAPELGYKIAFLDSSVNLINATFNLIWDF